MFLSLDVEFGFWCVGEALLGLCSPGPAAWRLILDLLVASRFLQCQTAAFSP